MEFKSKYNAVKVINGKKRVFASLLASTIMTTCVSCSIIDNEIKVKPIDNNVIFCNEQNVSLSNGSNIYLNNGKGPKVKILQTENNMVELLLEKNDSIKIIKAQKNSKFRINDTPVQICSIDNLKNDITLASSKKITQTPYKNDIDELYATGIFVIVMMAMVFGSSMGLKNSENCKYDK